MVFFKYSYRIKRLVLQKVIITLETDPSRELNRDLNNINLSIFALKIFIEGVRCYLNQRDKK